MANGWSSARRAKQRMAIRRWKPWDHSTGPKTNAGKKAVSRNAYRGAARLQFRALVGEVEALLRVHADGLHRLCQQPGKGRGTNSRGSL